MRLAAEKAAEETPLNPASSARFTKMTESLGRLSSSITRDLESMTTHVENLTSSSTSAPGVELKELVRRHDQLISLILQEEEELITAHRAHVDSVVDCVKDEMTLIQRVDRPGSDVDSYVLGLDKIMSKKEKHIKDIRERVERFQEHLREEDALSKLFQKKKMGILEDGEKN